VGDERPAVRAALEAEGEVELVEPPEALAASRDGQIAELSAPGGRLVVNYQAKSLATTVMRQAMRLVLRASRQPDPLAGEPWRSLWQPNDMRKMLRANGFDVTSDSDLLALTAGLDLPADNNGSLRNGRVLVAARR